ncbi:hypothetical protein [Pseudoalteromonas sp. R3]|uniref:hypothetical protein n=1 Tax=Pseudoalteromonas sp. R3 TaxID=1709477 RepID=UPI0006B62418|nr:hypothetical protein [Pseudoalteromonas sp. R3]
MNIIDIRTSLYIKARFEKVGLFFAFGFKNIYVENADISSFKQVYITVILHLMRDLPTDHAVRMTNTPK